MIRKNRAINLLLATTAVCYGNAHAAGLFGDAPTGFDDRPYVSFWGSYDISDHLRGTGHGVGGGLAIGKPFSNGLEVEVLGSYLHFGAKDNTSSSGGLLGGLLGGSGSSGSSAQNVAVGGVGANIYLAQNGATSLDGFYVHGDAMYGKAAVFDIGAGYSIPLASVGPLSDLSVRVEALYHKQGHYDEPVFNVGLRIPIGARPQPPLPSAPPPAEVEVTPIPAPPPPPAPLPCQPPAPGQPMTLDGCKRGDVIILRGVNFDYDKATLTVNARALLDQVADALRARPDIRAEIDGHTDGIGSVTYNLSLSDRRAKSVKSYLVAKGISSYRMTTRGFGKSRPIADNATAEGRELNRRVELKVVDAAEHPGVVVTPPMGSMGVIPAAGAVAATLATPPAGPTAVSITGFAFSPAQVVVPRGTTVTWTNNDSPAHTVSFADGDSGTLRKGANYSRTFGKPGEYDYHCSIHPGMTGKVIVQ